MARASRRAGSQDAADPARLHARPGEPRAGAPTGLQPLGLDPARDSLLYVPSSYTPVRPAPLALLLHGAGGNAHHGLSLLLDLADEAGAILLAPTSRGGTWDLLLHGYGTDVEQIDRALGQTFDQYAVDPGRLAIGGFSDGASYALSLSLSNGDLFTHVLAYSPGFLAPAAQIGAPRIYVSHGTHDDVLPIDACSRRLVPALQRAGYDVRYHEFDGPHTVPPAIAQESLAWWLGD